MATKLLSISDFVPLVQRKPDSAEQVIIDRYMHINVGSFFDTLCGLNPDDEALKHHRFTIVNLQITQKKQINRVLSGMTIGQLLNLVLRRYYHSYNFAKQHYVSQQDQSARRKSINEKNTAGDFLVSGVLLQPFLLLDYFEKQEACSDTANYDLTRRKYTLKEFLSSSRAVQIRDPEEIMQLIVLMSRIPIRSLFQRCGHPAIELHCLHNAFMEQNLSYLRSLCPKLWPQFDPEHFSDQSYGMFAQLQHTYRINQHTYANYHYDEPNQVLKQLTEISTGFTG